jgi:uncharacterized damage-inducible protein DinB
MIGRMDKRADVFLDPADDPRFTGATQGADERATLLDYLRSQRLTLEIKCAGLDAEQLARRAVPPSTMSLLGLVRHLADVERQWFRQRLAGEAVPLRFQNPPDDPDGDFDGAVADPAVVDAAWAAWREECAYTDRFIAGVADLGQEWPTKHGPVSLRDLLVHMVEEYARHMGHADLLRECIDGRLGQ